MYQCSKRLTESINEQSFFSPLRKVCLVKNTIVAIRPSFEHLRMAFENAFDYLLVFGP